MKFYPLILTLASATAVGVYVAVKSSTVTPSNPFPSFARFGLSKTNFTIQWPGDASWATNFDWVFEVASNAQGPWWAAEQSRQPDADTNAFVKMHGARFIRLRGTSTLQVQPSQL